MTALYILSLLVTLAALGSVWRAKPVHAALFMALALSMIAVLYLFVGAAFIGLVQFMVYVGAVAILIVFSLLITRPSDESEEIERRKRSVWVGLACILPVVAVLMKSVIQGHPPVVDSDGGLPALPLAKIGHVLFEEYAPAVLAVAVLLTSVMIGAALFARADEGEGEPENGTNNNQ